MANTSGGSRGSRGSGGSGGSGTPSNPNLRRVGVSPVQRLIHNHRGTALANPMQDLRQEQLRLSLNEKHEIACKLLAKGVDIEIITYATGLSLVDIRGLQRNNGTAEL